MAMQNINGKMFYPHPFFMANNWLPTNEQIDAANEKVEWLFIAPKAGLIRKIHYRISNFTSGATIDCRLESVSASTGNASGSLWGTNTNGSDSPSGTGWRTVTLTADATVAKGDLLCMVIAQPASSPGSMILGSYRSAANIAFPYSGLFTGSWTKETTFGGNGAIEYSDGTFAETSGLVPFSANTTTVYTSASTPNVRGLRFSIPVAARCRGCWIYINPAAGASITVKLYDSDGATVLRSYTYDGDISVSNSSVTFGTRFIEWSSTVDLLPNTFYRLVIVPDANNLSALENSVNAAGLMDCFGIGQNGHLTTATNPTVEGSWTQTLTTVPMMGLMLSGFDDAAVLPQNMLINPGMSGGMRG